MSDTYIKIIDGKDDTKVYVRGDIEDLVNMVVRICDHDDDIRTVVMASAMAICYLDGMDDIEQEINNL